MIRILFVLMMGIWLLESYGLQTWKKNPPVFQSEPLINPPSNLVSPDMQEPFYPPFLSPKHNQNTLEPLEGILPQVPPANIPSIDSIVPKENKIKRQEFLISYKLYVKDGIVQGEKYNISRPIKSRIHSGDYIFDYSCMIDTYIGDLVGDDSSNYAVEIILRQKKDAVLDCLYKSGVQIRDDTISNNLSLSAKTLLTLRAKKVQAYLDNGFLILEVWKEKK
ncbi:hypothetical protein [Helicobacter sp. 13S00477-4]|uniref:hypothetical protein n=1 Tax=Helicobacter sp. 13S00477-4 TaxID=1905759 RepID=UPI000BA63A27|nr:hypothetical protein [Helicobacter sp. 13S00477-4]PAF52044.1 hypothetical protein BKH44_04005 [Helicobacter sp. 13S00477-4]